MAKGTTNTGVDRHGKPVVRGSILRDPLCTTETQWVVSKVDTAGAWVKDHPTPDAQSAIMFTWPVVARLEVVDQREPAQEAA